MSDVNVELLRTAVRNIDQHPETWNQDDWGRKSACGTTMCLAGHIVHAAGYELSYTLNAWGVFVADHTTSGEFIPDLAQELLNIDWVTGDQLWYVSNDLEELKDTIYEVLGVDLDVQQSV